MTDRHAGYLVTLQDDIREDDAEALMAALRMLKGVLSVDPVPSDIPLFMARVDARARLQHKVSKAVLAAFKDEPGDAR